MNDFIKSGQFIAKLRSERGLTQEGLGEIIGTSGKTISKWERGQNVPDVLSIQKLASVFGVTLTEIINGERNKVVSPRIVKLYKNKKIRYLFYGFTAIFLIIFLLLLMYFCNNYDKFKIYRFKGSGQNYDLTGNIYQVNNEYKLVIDDFFVYDTDKYDDLKIDTYKVNVYLDGAVIYSFNEGKLIDDNTENKEYIKFSKIVEKINASDFILQQIIEEKNADGYLEISFVTNKKAYSESYKFDNVLQERNNSLYYDKRKSENERATK